LVQPGSGVYGIGGRAAVRQPALDALDLGLDKSFAIAKEQRLQFRLESFNALNHPQQSAGFMLLALDDLELAAAVPPLEVSAHATAIKLHIATHKHNQSAPSVNAAVHTQLQAAAAYLQNPVLMKATRTSVAKRRSCSTYFDATCPVRISTHIPHQTTVPIGDFPWPHHASDSGMPQVRQKNSTALAIPHFLCTPLLRTNPSFRSM
jgi:hypothetical protein